MRRRHILAFAALAWPVAAEAHAILVESIPAINATAPPGPIRFMLRYNSRIDAGRSRLTLYAPDGSAQSLPITKPERPDVLAAAADLAPGAWRLRWQVLAVDGHITRGDVPFQVKAP